MKGLGFRQAITPNLPQNSSFNRIIKQKIAHRTGIAGKGLKRISLGACPCLTKPTAQPLAQRVPQCLTQPLTPGQPQHVREPVTKCLGLTRYLYGSLSSGNCFMEKILLKVLATSPPSTTCVFAPLPNVSVFSVTLQGEGNNFHSFYCVSWVERRKLHVLVKLATPRLP